MDYLQGKGANGICLVQLHAILTVYIITCGKNTLCHMLRSWVRPAVYDLSNSSIARSHFFFPGEAYSVIQFLKSTHPILFTTLKPKPVFGKPALHFWVIREVHTKSMTACIYFFNIFMQLLQHSFSKLVANGIFVIFVRHKQLQCQPLVQDGIWQYIGGYSLHNM